jgi:hypothetical protein
MKKLTTKEPEAIKSAWQRYYFLGRMPDGSSPAQHLSKLRVPAPVDRRERTGSDPPKR